MDPQNNQETCIMPTLQKQELVQGQDEECKNQGKEME